MRDTVGDKFRPFGHFSSGVLAGDFLFVSGQGPTDLATGALVPGDTRAQVLRCLENVEAIVAEAGGTRDDIVKMSVWLHDWSDYATLNGAFAEFFPTKPPARSTVQGARPAGHRVAIEAIAYLPRAGR